MDDIYEPVYDSAALEDHLLPEPVETFLLVALCWCLVAWLLRLCYMAMHLLDLQAAIKSQRLSAHDSVPLHSEVVNLDPQTKNRFFSFLRARTPATPTATVPCYSVPLSLNGATLHVAASEPHRLEVSLALSCSATMQLFWGVTPEASSRIVDLTARPRRGGAEASSSSRANSLSSRSRGAARWLTGASSEADVAQVHPRCESSAGVGGRERNSSPSAVSSSSERISSSSELLFSSADARQLSSSASSTRDTGDGASAGASAGASRGAPPARGASGGGGYLRELGGRFAPARGASASPVMRQLNALQRGSGSAAATSPGAISAGIEMRSGDEMRASASASARAPGQVHTHASAGAHGATHGMPAAAEGGPSHTLPAECFRLASPPRRVGAGTQLLEAFCASEMPSDLGLVKLPLLLVLSNFGPPSPARGDRPVSPIRREPKLAAAVTASESDASPPAAAAEASASVLPAALTGAPEQPVGCCMVHLSFRFGAAAAEPPGLEADGAAAATEAGTAVGASGATPDATPAATPDATPDTALPSVQTPTQAATPAQTLPLSPEPDMPAASGEAGTFTVAATLGKALARTPNAVLQLHDIFGLEDWDDSPECVACLTEPKDTILLPCRHLCVCHQCFDHLTLDKCPVCRAPFQSYLRFNIDDVAVGDDDAACPACDAPAEAAGEP